MSWTYNFIDHTADIAVDLNADSYEELFTASANAWKESVFEKNIIKKNDEKNFELEENSPEELLVAFLDELNYLLFVKKWISSSIEKINVINENNIWKLNVTITGGNFDEIREEIKVEIKAVTFHQMNIKMVDGQISTRLVFDI